jgi:hypothetical protein
VQHRIKTRPPHFAWVLLELWTLPMPPRTSVAQHAFLVAYQPPLENAQQWHKSTALNTEAGGRGVHIAATKQVGESLTLESHQVILHAVGVIEPHATDAARHTGRVLLQAEQPMMALSMG